MDPKQKYDPTKIPKDLQDKLIQWEKNRPENKQVQLLEDIADMLQSLFDDMDKKDAEEKKSVSNMGALLMDVRENLKKIAEKKDPESPDYTKPLVEALSKVEKSIVKAILEQESPDAPVFKPNIKVEAPKVSVPDVLVDTKEIEKVLKTEIPIAFAQTVASMPQPETEEVEHLLEKLYDMMDEKLESIDKATRMKPQPGSMAVTSTTLATSAKQDDIITAISGMSGSTVYSKPTDAYSLSDIDDSTSTEYYGYENADGAWYIKKFASNAFTFVKGASGYSTAWTNRASQTYASYATTF